MSRKTLILIVLIAAVATSSYSQDSKKDSVRKVSWAVRVAGGMNIIRYKFPNDGDYLSHNTKSDGSLAQIGIKFSNAPYLISVIGSRTKTISLTCELNYIVSQHHLNYTYYEYTGQGGVYYEADYLFSMHSAQLAILPKIAIGTKKIVYISLGLFGSKPFYVNSIGLVEEYYPGYGTGTFATADTTINYKDNEIKTTFNDFNFGAIANFGFNIPVKKHLLTLELRLQPGLTSTIKNPDLINYSVLLSTSYSFW